MLLEVGKPYMAGLDSLATRAEYNFRAGQHELLLCFSRNTEAEVRAIDKGEAEFALIVSGDLIVVLYRFGDALEWSDAPYSWHLVPADERVLPETPETRALLSIVLVDADRNIVRALRAITLAPEFTFTLHAAIRAQARRAWDAASYNFQLRRAFMRWPTAADMLAVAVARSRGGA